MINVLYIAVGEGGSDQALITLIKELKCKIRQNKALYHIREIS